MLERLQRANEQGDCRPRLNPKTSAEHWYEQAKKDGNRITLTDEKGRQIIVPSSVLGYVEIGAEEVRRVGFGAL